MLRHLSYNVMTLANFVSLLRALMAFPIIYGIHLHDTRFTLTWICIAVLSDALDGFLARFSNAVTPLGKMLDPAADALLIVSVCFYLVLMHGFPAWFFCLFLLRYIVIAATAIAFLNQFEFALSANWTGKWSAGFTTLAVSFYLFPLPALDTLRSLALTAATSLLLISWWFYTQTFLEQWQKHPNKHPAQPTKTPINH